MTSLDLFYNSKMIESVNIFSELIVNNNKLIESARNVDNILTKLTNLSSANITKLQEDLLTMGVTTQDFNDLRTGLNTIINGIKNNLKTIKLRH